MIKILQTGDLHIGKVFYEHSLIDDQKDMLNQLSYELKTSNPPYDALLLTGDIYDRAVPPPEAVEIFDNFLTEIHHECPNLAIGIISGNHDSPKRLAFGSNFFAKQKIHIATSINDVTKPIILNNKEAVIYLIPFLQAGIIEIPCNEKNSIGQEVSSLILKKQQEMVQEAINRIITENKILGNLPAIVCAHVCTFGVERSDSEKISLGTADEIDASIFKPFMYTALGHIHKPQKISDNIFYAGSPLSYSFKDSSETRSFLNIQIDTTKNTIVTSKIPIKPLHPVARLKGKFSSFFEEDTFDSFQNSYLEITYTDDEIIENPASLLRKKFPYVMAVKKLSSDDDENITFDNLIQSKKEAQDDNSLYDMFINDIYKNNQNELSKAQKRKTQFTEIISWLDAKNREEGEM